MLPKDFTPEIIKDPADPAITLPPVEEPPESPIPEEPRRLPGKPEEPQPVEEPPAPKKGA